MCKQTKQQSKIITHAKLCEKKKNRKQNKNKKTAHTNTKIKINIINKSTEKKEEKNTQK